ncbi:DUF4383 domain-containing protein [Streptomyces sp. NPDC087917]|uniref:DUF4383 domain-containing protein n=1 Tax=Streptomyces sp. NPDC087917 TaxID=3155060 RepID=UPI00342AB508
MKMSDELPINHRLATVYRYGALLCGLILIGFGVLGFANALSPFDTYGETIAGLATNTALSVISVVVGLALAAGAFVGGNFASSLNITVGALFLISGFAHIFILDKGANILGFGMTNVMFSFVMGLIIMTFGMYGRVSSKLPHDNPYWQHRHTNHPGHSGHNDEPAARAHPAPAGRATDPAARIAHTRPTRPLGADDSAR